MINIISNSGYEGSKNTGNAMHYTVKRMSKNVNKRRVVSRDEFVNDNKHVVNDIFIAIHKAIDKYNLIMSDYPINVRIRNFEAVTLNQQIVSELFAVFGDSCKFGKYKRFILSLNGYQYLVKKLNNKNMPMNIITKHCNNVNNQGQMSLFDETTAFKDVIEPILYIGYRKNRLGVIDDLKIVYIDENKLQWQFKEDELTEFISPSGNHQEISDSETTIHKVQPKLKDGSSQRRAE